MADQPEKVDKAEKSGRTGTKAPSDAKVVPDGDGPKKRGSKLEAKHLRVQLARVIGLVFLVLALTLALAALFIALEANPDNAFVKFVLDLADTVDLGIFDLDSPIKEFGGSNGATKEALLNYGSTLR